MPSEFDLIDRYFRTAADGDSVIVGVGDDAAVLRVPVGQELVVTVDTLVSGIHFPVDTAPKAVGHKALAVNLSDLAAMGATPTWVTLALTLPEADESWVEAFADGFLALARRHGVALVGGDTTRGPLTISVQAGGWVSEGTALLRRGAQPGDDIYVTGTLGDAALALDILAGRTDAAGGQGDACRARLDFPTPRVGFGESLRGLAHAAIDVSDGLLADLGHVLRASEVAAAIELESLPLGEPVRAAVAASGRWTWPLAGGDDYELLFTAAQADRDRVQAVGEACGCPVTRIGRIETGSGLKIIDAQGGMYQEVTQGWDHFAEGRG